MGTTTGPGVTSAVGRVRRAIRPPTPTPVRGFVVGVCAALSVVRLAYVWQPLRFDEAGYLMVARQWHGEGEFPYGDYWVDRPPGLLLIFKAAALFESDQAVRVLAIPFSVVFVVAAARAAWLLGGTVPARLAAVVAAALMGTPATGADQADGELFAAALVMASIAVLLDACQRDTRSLRSTRALAAGVLAVSGPLVKQNFVEGLVFGAVLLGVAAWRWPEGRAGSVRVVVGAVLGAAAPVAVVLIWAYQVGLGELGYAVVGFRMDALSRVVADRSDAVLSRGVLLVVLAVVSGILPVLMRMLVVSWGARRSGSPAEWATAAIALLGVLSIIAGGSYWPHYLLQLGPATVLGTALMARSPSGRRWVRRTSTAVVCSALAASAAMAVYYTTAPSPWWPQRTGEWLRSSSAPGDTAVVVYGAASVHQSSGLASPYPHLWSLPVRVLDPDLERLEAAVRGPAAPTWIVQRSRFDSWALDEDQELRRQVEESYRVVAEICGNPVWLRRDLTRDLARPPVC